MYENGFSRMKMDGSFFKKLWKGIFAWGWFFLLSVFWYRPLLNQTFINYDTSEYIFSNPWIVQSSWESLKVFLGVHVYWMPLTWLSHWMDYWLYHDSYIGHLTTQLLMHSLNITIVFALTRLCLRHFWPQMISPGVKFIGSQSRWITGISILVALIWGFHPFRVESVAWIVERKGVLSAIFSLSAIYFYLRNLFKNNHRDNLSSHSLGVWLCLFCACASKPTGMVLPVIFFLLDSWFHPERVWVSGQKIRSLKSYLKKRWGYWLVAIFSGLAAILGQSESSSIGLLTVQDLMMHLFVVPAKWFFYIIQHIVPYDVHPIYPFNYLIQNTAFLVISWIFLLALIVFLIRFSTKTRSLRYVLIINLVVILPMIGLIQVGNQTLAGRWTYLSVIPVLIFLAAALSQLIISNYRLRWVKLVSGGMILLIFSSWFYVSRPIMQTFENTYTYWMAAVTRYPDQMPMGNFSLGNYFFNTQRFDLALPFYTNSVLSKYNNDRFFEVSASQMVRCYSKLGRLDDVLQEMEFIIGSESENCRTKKVLATEFLKNDQPLLYIKWFWESVACLENKNPQVSFEKLMEEELTTLINHFSINVVSEFLLESKSFSGKESVYILAISKLVDKQRYEDAKRILSHPQVASFNPIFQELLTYMVEKGVRPGF